MIARIVGALLTDDEVRVLEELRDGLPLKNRSEHESALASALRKLLTPAPDACIGCFTERARIVTTLNEQLVDETPTNADPSPLAMARDAGYRAGWNDRARSLAKGLTS